MLSFFVVVVVGMDMDTVYQKQKEKKGERKMQPYTIKVEEYIKIKGRMRKNVRKWKQQRAHQITWQQKILYAMNVTHTNSHENI